MATAADRATKRTRIYLRSEVEKHNTAKDCWVVHNNRVYDVRRAI